MKYKLLVLDIDGTLLNSRKEISQRTLATLIKVQQMGMRIVLASGRPPHGVRPIANMLELHKYGGYVMVYNGGIILQADNREVLFEKRMDISMMDYLNKKATKNNFPIFTYHLDTIVTTHPDDPHINREAELNDMRIIGVRHFPEAVTFQPCKCMMVSDNTEELKGLEAHLQKRLNGVFDVFRSENYFLEIVPQSINKGDTLSVLLDKLNVNRDEVIAFGDGVCDIPMLQLAGTGVAMGNANEAVKRCADYITSGNDEDGVAEMLEKMVIADIRPANIPLEELNARAKHALMGNLGIQYTYADEDRIEATMPVDERTRQPFGILHGGATLALAETVAGLGSLVLCNPDEIAVGMQVSGNHMSSAHEGDTVRAVARIIHKGRSSHVWDVNIYTSTDKLVSSVRVVNSVLKKR
ncbi:Cof-type HAD-IIB family hydrolase [Bacteroides sp. OttesenSCG-928-D19]|nr:Cof-type HAD-IIB family hydrolase [Bacteroides sp. OttesenSCG-928-D19]